MFKRSAQILTLGLTLGFALGACTSGVPTGRVVMAPAPGADAGGLQPAPQAPFDETPIGPAESVGAGFAGYAG